MSEINQLKISPAPWIPGVVIPAGPDGEPGEGVQQFGVYASETQTIVALTGYVGVDDDNDALGAANSMLIAQAPAMLQLISKTRDIQIALRNGGLPRDENFIDEATAIINAVLGISEEGQEDAPE